MTQDTKPSIIGSAVTGWRDAFSALGSMPGVAGTAFVLLLVVTAAGLPLTPASDATELEFGAQIVSFALGIAQGFLLTPLAIAVHRYVLLGEVSARYSANPSDPRFLRFFGFTVALQVLTIIPGQIMLLAGRAGGVAMFIVGLIAFVLLIVTCIISVRTVILFPAIAVDAPGAAWGNALRDSKGHSWRILFIMLMTGLPMIVLLVPFYWLLLRPEVATFGSRLVGVVIEAALNTVTLAAFAAVASRLYRTFSAQLGRSPNLVQPSPA